MAQSASGLFDAELRLAGLANLAEDGGGARAAAQAAIAPEREGGQAGAVAAGGGIGAGTAATMAAIGVSAGGLSGRQRAAATERSARLLKITAALAEAVTPREVFEALVDQLATALDASSVGLWVLSDDGTTAQLVRATGYTDDIKRRMTSVPLSAAAGLPAVDVIRTGKPLWLRSQPELLAAYPHLAGSVDPSRSYSIACLPILVRGRAIASLGLTFEGASHFDEEYRSFLLLVAHYSGQALERLRWLEAEQHSRERAELLYALAGSVIDATSAADVFSLSLETIQRALGASRSSILVFDADGVMRFKAWNGLSDAYRSAVEGHSPWKRDAQNPVAILVENVESDPAWTPYLPTFRQEGIGALAFIPLVAAGQLLGKFMVYYDRPWRVAPHELAMATAIANHVAAAIARFSALDALKTTVRFNEMFTAILGHDLRNPLSAIMTAAQLVVKRGDSEKLAQPMARILNSGERMARMIEQLLDFTRVRVGAGIPLQPALFDLVPVVRQVLDELEDANPDWTLRLYATGDAVGCWDRDRLSQVFSNLVGNAVQHGHAEHGVTVSVDGTDPRHVQVEVHNMGEILPHQLPGLFEPLAGGDRGRHKSRGLGLGLFITQQIARAHGGNVGVTSTAVDGTRMRLSLPRNPALGRSAAADDNR